ncbi:MAG: fasciclin domain-containing protein [Myxococcota bacterium]
MADDIVEIAASTGTFNTLLAAAEAAGLVGVLQSDGPLTVFAPTDEAFAALPEGTVESLLLPENKDQLIAILTYHVDDRKLTSDMLPHGTIHVKPVNTSERLTVTKSASGVTIDGANVISADIIADNGVIHVIDQVLIPGA